MRAIRLYTGFILLMLFLIASLRGHVVYASSNIDPDSDGSSYAYGENVGWVNLKPSSGDGVLVVDPLLLGYAWSENVGWINFSCLNSASCGTLNWGVLNDGTGNLSGYAWGENVGWINFAPTGGGVTINTDTGIFSGTAWGENIGWISFVSNGSVTFRVKTSWRAANQVPNLSYSSETGYGSDGITPDSGTASTSFIYKVIYTDGNNDPPAFVKVHIDGDTTGITMNLDTAAASTFRDGDYTNGEQYYYTTFLVAGTHNYYFSASDGIDTTRIPSSGSLSGPVVSNLTFVDGTFPIGTVGISYVTLLPVSGGVPPYTWSILSGLPPGLTLDSATGIITGTPTTQGTYGFTAYVTDGSSYTYSKAFSITINPNPVNNPPWLIPIGAKNINEGVNLYFMISGIDPDGDMLIYGATGLPTGATFNASTGTFFWTPDYTQAGTYNVTFTVSDGSLTASETVQITVNNINQSPVLNPIGLKSVNEGANLNFTIIGSDPDGDLLTYSATGLPPGATFDVTTQTFNWTPDYTQAGAYSVIFTVSDGSGTASETVAINVNDVPTSNTPTGSGVTVAPSTAVPLTIIFDNVTSSGSTTVSTSETGQPPPSGFKLGTPPIYYDITTTATYSGLIQVCFTYDETQFTTERNLQLFHLEGTIWIDITDTGYPDIVNNIICGTTTNLSPFIIAYVFYPAELPRTGQTTCYDSAGAVIACAGTGQDGEIQAGIPWPDPRFTDNGDGTITDNLTGLMWTKDANLMASKDPVFDTDGTAGDGSVEWYDALDYVAKLNLEAYLGYSDWHLPNINELESLVDAEMANPALPISHLFINVQEGPYWSSTTSAVYSGYTWVVNVSDGLVHNRGTGKRFIYYPVWPVRSGGPSIVSLPRTGQTSSFYPGDDGNISSGVAWPNPRFTDNGDGTVTDNLTSLMWTKDATISSPTFGYSDWRRPNRKELQSLIDRSRFDPALPAGHPFVNAWSNTTSATTYSGSMSYVWFIFLYDGVLYYQPKSDPQPIWWVRGGKIAPTLSYSSESGYVSDGVIPNSGIASTSFTYKVVYKDAKNNPPSFMKVHIDGDSIGTPMGLDTSAVLTLRDGNYANGEQYYYTTTLIAGIHNYYFTASDGIDTVRLPSSGTLSGPTVSDLGFVDGWLLPSGIVGISYVTLLPVSGGTPPYTWSIPSGLPTGLTLNSSTGFITGTPTTQGTYGFTAYVTDSSSYTYSRTFSITIDPNQPPVGDSQLVTTAEDTAAVITLSGSDPEVQPLTFSLISGPTNGGLSGTAPNLTYTPNTNFNGSDSFTFKVNDGLQDSNIATVSITITPVNDPPILSSIGAKSVNEGSLLNFTLSGSDPEGDTITFSAAGLPNGASFDPMTRTFSWTPDCSQAGLYNVTFTVSDGNLTDTEVVAITVNDVQNTYYRDADGDTYGNASVTTLACTQPSGYVSNSSDCNDGNASIHPGATEVCNGVDDNCNGQVDEGVQNTYYRDADNDTYGNASITMQACTQPSGYVSNSTDCNDSNASIHPGATEVCNGVDDNCNGQVDEGVQNTYYRDGDSDTYGNASVTTQACAAPSGYVSNSSDCNDSNASIKPGATEVCNGVDDNCNGQVDEGVQNTYYRDADNDTHGNASVTTQACTAPSGYVSNSSDCNDGNASINPGATEACNGVDDNCNSQIDEGFALSTYYRDADNDTYGNASVTTQACAAPSGYVSNSSDCNDSNASIKPGATEVCNGVDDNCNGQIDEGVLNTYYIDADSDTYGNSSNSTQACSVPTGYATNNSDCNDGNVSVHPGANEICNGIDDNCDGGVDEGCTSSTTPTGSNVGVTPTSGVVLTFTNVTTSGTTGVTTSGTGQPPPAGFRLGNPPIYYDIATTASYTGPIQVCLTYNDGQFATERSLRLFHLEGGAWKDITDTGYPDTVNNVICGTTSSLSPFIIAQQSSTAVTLTNLSARLEGDQVALTWSTSSETNNEGFVVLRGDSPSGPFVPITSSMIPAVGGPGMKATYSFMDSNVETGKTYYYRLQDVDSRGVVTTHNVIPVTTVVAGGERPFQKIENQKQVIQSIPQEIDQEIGKKSGRDSVVVGGSIALIPDERRVAEGEISSLRSVQALPSVASGNLAMTSGGTASPRNDSSFYPHPASPVKGEEYSESPAATTGVIALQAQGPSSFSVSIEDDKGNIIMVSRVEDTESTSTSTSDLMVADESGRLVLTWQGKGKVKGFILHRTEKGKDNYTPISSLIPYFGKDDKDIFLYRFTDNTTKPGVKYDYRLERVASEFKMGMRD